MSDVERLFGELLELSGQERSQRLRELSVESPEIHTKLRELLLAHEQAGSFLQSTVEFAGTDLIGKQIRQYKLRELIGEGGMGVVYVAEQEKPLRRKVALKVIKPGMDSKAVLARFDAERQALALMNHPNIAKVLDAGTTSEGRPFFVMELVSGQPITDYCDAQKLTIRERLELFVEVCQAIQHAHQKGIIHRDIKPSNVLVTELDGKPVAKTIDFGVAKALNQSLTEHSIYTAFQAVIGTPLYMSPEQASFSAVDVDTRSDVYSLGVLLYELLTGTTPFTREDLQQSAQDEVLRLIREQEPPRPSNRISSLGETATQVSSLRRSQPDQLGRIVRGDLDWIVMKALDKERTRRYESPTSLSNDIANFLSNDVVQARPPTLGYQLRKLYSRNRHLAALLGVTLSSLLILVGILAWGNIKQRALTAELEQINGEMEAKGSELERLNGELVENGFTRVFELAQSGRLQEARDKLNLLVTSSNDERRIRLYGDIVNLFGNEKERREARDDLFELDKSGDDLLVKSMLALSFIRTNDEWSYHDRVAELFELEPVTYEEYLFRGAAFAYAHPAIARTDLQNAVRQNPESAAAHTLLSQALQSYTMERRCDQAEYHELARECHIEAVVGSRASIPGNINAVIASLDAHCTWFLSLQQASEIEQVDDCVKSWRSELFKSFELSYDPQLHRAWIDAYRVLSRFESPLALEIEEKVVSDPEVSAGTSEVVIKLIQVHLLKRDDMNARRLAAERLDDIRDYDLMATLPILNAVYLEKGLAATKASVFRMITEQKPHPIASALNWPVLTLLGEKQQAAREAEKFRDFCHGRPQDPRARAASRVADWMAKPSQHPHAFSDQLLASKDNHFLILQAFNEAMQSCVTGNRRDATSKMAITRDNPAFRVFINGWAEVFLQRLDDPDFLPWLEYTVEHKL